MRRETYIASEVRRGSESDRFAPYITRLSLALLLASLAILLTACSGANRTNDPNVDAKISSPLVQALGSEPLPPYSGEPSVVVNDDVPAFTDAELSRGPFETYSPLDRRGRCGPAFALIGPETMPDEPRGEIGEVRPTGFQIAKYPWVDGRYLYNRCHLIGYQLAGENANELNLITGTRSLNIAGMLPFENEIARYVHKTGNHVLYRVTPVFEGGNLVASGVLMEARSVEDGGSGACFCRWCYNVEPGVSIDYATGDNHADGTISEQ